MSVETPVENTNEVNLSGIPYMFTSISNSTYSLQEALVYIFQESYSDYMIDMCDNNPIKFYQRYIKYAGYSRFRGYYGHFFRSRAQKLRRSLESRGLSQFHNIIADCKLKMPECRGSKGSLEEFIKLVEKQEEMRKTQSIRSVDKRMTLQSALRTIEVMASTIENQQKTINRLLTQ